MTVLQVCAYAAPYPGNFIASLNLLEEKLNKQGHNTIYAFPETAKDKEWCKNLSQTNKVYYLPVAKARILPKTYSTFKKIYKENNIHFMHSHFGLYDIPATINAPKSTKVFWHLHDAIRPSNDMGRNLLNRIQYGFLSKKANLISVSEYYRKKVVNMGFYESNTYTILNGIDISRVEECKNINKPYEFLTFGWDFHIKGSDLIFKAMEKLADDGFKAKLLFVGIQETKKKVNEYFNGIYPEWLEFYDPVTDINLLYEKAELFIQASRKETFSYAVCEAAYAGLPVIASDIPGLEWAKTLSTVNFFESENHEQLFELLKAYLVSDNYVTKEQITNTRDIIQGKYSLEIWTDKIVKKYNNL